MNKTSEALFDLSQNGWTEDVGFDRGCCAHLYECSGCLGAIISLSSLAYGILMEQFVSVDGAWWSGHVATLGLKHSLGHADG